MTRRRILVVEDDAVLSRVLRDSLSSEGFDVACVGDGGRMSAAASEFAPDLVLLDLMLPTRSGFELCEELRHGPHVKVIILTARDGQADKLRAFDLGADDYLTKPFDLEELVARVHAVLRRDATGEQLILGEATIDFRHMRALRDGKATALTHRELELLRYLADRQGHVVHRQELLSEVWGNSNGFDTRALDNTIARLRRKLEMDPRHPRYIQTVHGHGYVLDPTARTH